MGMRAILAAGIVAGAAAGGGCGEPDHAPAGPVPSPSGAAASLAAPREPARWPFWPTHMRLHPLTRLTTDEAGRPIIEARVEMFDRDGQTTKASGQLRIDLHDAADEGPAGSLAHWNLDLRDLGFNRERFDDVTNTYLFPLKTEPGQIPPHPVLRAYFVSDDGTTFSARLGM